MIQKFYLEKLSELENNFSVKIITGVRGVGKSTLLKNFAEKLLAEGVPQEEIIFVDCAENLRPKNFQWLYDTVNERTAELERFFLLADEIDRVDEWEKAVNALFVGTPAEIFVTGSSDTLAEKISALLPDNCDVLKMLPLSFVEYAKIFPQKKSTTVLKDFLNFGALPVTADVHKNILPKLLRGVGYKINFELVAQNSLYNAEMLRTMTNYLACNIGVATNVNRISEYLESLGHKSIQSTVKKYFEIIMDAGLFKHIPYAAVDGNRIISGTKKFYCVDNGLLRALSFSKDIDEKILVENAVCMELLRRGADVRFANFGELSVNFVMKPSGGKIFFHAAAAGDNAKDFSDVLPAMPRRARKILISYSPRRNFNGVECITLKDFLTDTEIFLL